MKYAFVNYTTICLLVKEVILALSDKYVNSSTKNIPKSGLTFEYSFFSVNLLPASLNMSDV